MQPPQMINLSSRETREFAYESKFLLSDAQADAIRAWARLHMGVDPHGSGIDGDLYRVSSIYFDTPNLDVFMRRGSYGRSKYRLRRYGTDEGAFMERKTKTRELVNKRRTRVRSQDIARLHHAMDANWVGYWFQRRLALRQLQPVCQINYQRVARMGYSETGPCRLTLDSMLTGQIRTDTEFAAIGGAALLANRHILELKYRHALPVLFKRLLSEFAPVTQRISKYRLAIESLGLSTPGLSNPAVSRSEYADGEVT